MRTVRLFPREMLLLLTQTILTSKKNTGRGNIKMLRLKLLVLDLNRDDLDVLSASYDSKVRANDAHTATSMVSSM